MASSLHSAQPITPAFNNSTCYPLNLSLSQQTQYDIYTNNVNANVSISSTIENGCSSTIDVTRPSAQNTLNYNLNQLLPLPNGNNVASPIFHTLHQITYQSHPQSLNEQRIAKLFPPHHFNNNTIEKTLHRENVDDSLLIIGSRGSYNNSDILILEENDSYEDSRRKKSEFAAQFKNNENLSVKFKIGPQNLLPNNVIFDGSSSSITEPLLNTSLNNSPPHLVSSSTHTHQLDSDGSSSSSCLSETVIVQNNQIVKKARFNNEHEYAHNQLNIRSYNTEDLICSKLYSSPASNSTSAEGESLGEQNKNETNNKNQTQRKQLIRDEAYWERRRKNNDAAKRSRDSRRKKEDEVAVRAVILEQENLRLRFELERLRTEIERLRTDHRIVILNINPMSRKMNPAAQPSHSPLTLLDLEHEELWNKDFSNSKISENDPAGN